MDNDSGSGRGRSGGGSQVSGQRSTSGHSRVVSGVRTADTLEVLDGLSDSLIRVTVSVQALVDVRNKGGVGAVASSIGVVNTADNEVPGADASRDNARAGQSLSGSSRALRGGAGDGRQLGSRRLSSRGALNRGGLTSGRNLASGSGLGRRDDLGLGHSVAGGEDGSLSSSHRADGGADSNNLE